MGDIAGVLVFVGTVLIGAAIYQRWGQISTALKENVVRVLPKSVRTAKSDSATTKSRRPLVALLTVAFVVVIIAVGILLKSLVMYLLATVLALILGCVGINILRQTPVHDLIPGSSDGYEGADGYLDGRHVFAVMQFLLSFGIYVVVFLFKTYRFGAYPKIPTLALVLLLAVLLCWALSGLTFFLDRYRIPLLAPIVIWAAFTSTFPQSDHFYRSVAIPKDQLTVSAAPARF